MTGVLARQFGPLARRNRRPRTEAEVLRAVLARYYLKAELPRGLLLDPAQVVRSPRLRHLLSLGMLS